MKKNIYLLVLLALIMAGCSGNNSTSSDTEDSPTLSSSSIGVIPEMSSPALYSSEGGQSATSSTDNSSSSLDTSSAMSSSSTTVATNAPISLFKIGGLAKTLNVTGAMSAIPYNVDLDTIYGTASFSFLVKNNSTSDITGLKFEFDLDYFKVTPDSIITLGAPSSASGIEQLIKVTVEHGTLASGGFADVLTGNQYGTLTISGHNDDGDFSVTYIMHVYAKRMIVHITIPDTLGVNYYKWRNGLDMIPNRADDGSINPVAPFQNSFRHAYVDQSSENCYLNLGSFTLDTSSNIHINDVTKYYKSFPSDGLTVNPDVLYLTSAGIPLSTTTTEMHETIINELNVAKRLSTYQHIDNNCVVLVYDEWKYWEATTQVHWWEDTQYILE